MLQHFGVPYPVHEIQCTDSKSDLIRVPDNSHRILYILIFIYYQCLFESVVEVGYFDY